MKRPALSILALRSVGRCSVAFSTAILLVSTAFGQEPSWQHPPKLVVGVVVDQMRVDYVYRYWDNFGDGGFKRLVRQGAFLRDAHYTYVPTVTGPGHASIFTGSVPAFHGIVENYPYDRASRSTMYCVLDTSVRGVGSDLRRSPARLQAATLADEIEHRTDRKGRTIGVSLKDRSSILSLGRTGDAAYWFASATGAFCSSTWYMPSLPAWVDEFNARGLAERYLDRTWTPYLPIERYHQAMPDSNKYEEPLVTGTRPGFPFPLRDWRAKGAGLDLILGTPWGNTITTDMALAAMEGEELGKDGITDLLAISYSSTDELGHNVGPRAVELEDMYIRLDLEIERLLTELDARVGVGEYTLFLTADHGVVDVPQYLMDLKGSAGYVSPRRLKGLINAALAKSGAAADSVLYMRRGELFFSDHKGVPLDDEGLALSRGIAQTVLMAEPAVLLVMPHAVDDVLNDRVDMISVAVHNGHMAQRSGDLQYVLRPGFLEATPGDTDGTEHSAGWNYDTHVPVLFFGQGIAHTEVLRRTAVADIVPTLTMIIGCALPDAAVGVAVPEVILR